MLADREGSLPLGLLKTTLLQLDSTFSERTFGAGSFRDFAEKLQKAGVLTVSQGRGGWMIGPANGSGALETTASVGNVDDAQPAASPAPVPTPASPSRPTAVIGTPADGVRELVQALGSIQIRRWPLYLRNVKQLLRQARPSFDERAYGFASLVDLLRAAHKEGAFRVDRDRQGVIRVFQGTAAPLPTPEIASPELITDRLETPDVDASVESIDQDLPLVSASEIAEAPPAAAEEPAPAPRTTQPAPANDRTRPPDSAEELVQIQLR